MWRPEQKALIVLERLKGRPIGERLLDRRGGRVHLSDAEQDARA
jgi:hypothetical protein